MDKTAKLFYLVLNMSFNKIRIVTVSYFLLNMNTIKIRYIGTLPCFLIVATSIILATDYVSKQTYLFVYAL